MIRGFRGGNLSGNQVEVASLSRAKTHPCVRATAHQFSLKIDGATICSSVIAPRSRRSES